MRLLLAAPHSGSGKTTFALALLLALKELGLKVQPFKVGPDYLDPTHLEAASGRRPYNLDGFFLDEKGLLALFRHGARGADFALVEGLMGLFDGKDPLGEVGSTAQAARLLKAPVALVVDAAAERGWMWAWNDQALDTLPGFYLHDAPVRACLPASQVEQAGWYPGTAAASSGALSGKVARPERRSACSAHQAASSSLYRRASSLVSAGSAP